MRFFLNVVFSKILSRYQSRDHLTEDIKRLKERCILFYFDAAVSYLVK